MKSFGPALFPLTDQPLVGDKRFVQVVESRYQNDSVFVSKTSKPMAGEAMPVRWTVVRRGMSMPLSVDFTSKMALGSGVELSVLILTACADMVSPEDMKTKQKRIFAKSINPNLETSIFIGMTLGNSIPQKCGRFKEKSITQSGKMGIQDVYFYFKTNRRTVA